MRGAIMVAVILLIIGAGGMLGTHTAPVLSIFSTGLQDNPDLNFTTYAANGAITSHTSFHLSPLSGVFSYGGNPIIISTWTTNGVSSAFGDVGTLNVTQHTLLSMIMNINITWDVLYYSQMNGSWQTLYPDAYHENFTAFSNMESAIAFPAFRIAHNLNGIIELRATIQLYTSPIGIYGGAYHKSGSMTMEAYIVPGSGTISVSPTVQQVGGTIYIHGQVNFGQYYVLLYGSSGYNGGSLIQNFTVNKQNGFYNFTYVIPQGAFTPSSSPNANEWTVELWNELLAQHTQQFFTVDHLNLIPPTPTITITDTPSNDMWVVGQTVNVRINAPSNAISGTSVTSIIVWVYYNEGGEPAPSSSLWIIDNQIFPVVNGTSAFSFQIGDLIQSITISAVAVDAQGRASNTSTIDIQASQITTGNTSQESIFALVVVAIVMGMGSAIIYFAYPGSGVDKLIVIGGLVGMMAMLYFPINHYFINSALIINWIMMKGA